MVNDIEHLFVYLLAICISSLEKYLLRSSAHFKINCFLLMSCMSSLYIYIILFDTFPLSAIWFTKLFSHFCLFSLLMVSFAVQKFLVWGRLTCSFLVFVAFSFGVRFKKSSRPMSMSLPPKDFYIWIYQGYWSAIFFSSSILLWFWYWGNSGVVQYSWSPERSKLQTKNT